MRSNAQWRLLAFTPPMCQTPSDGAPSPGPRPRAEVKALVIAALKAEAYSVAELAALVGVDADLVRSVVVTLRPHLDIVDRQRQVQRRGRVYVNVYRFRRGAVRASSSSSVR